MYKDSEIYIIFFGIFYGLGCRSILGLQSCRKDKQKMGILSSLTAAIVIGTSLMTGCTNPLATQYFKQGVEKYEAGNYQGAISNWSKAIEINPQDAIAYYNRGLAKDGLQDYHGAIVDYTKAIEINPQYAAAYSNRGVAKDDLKDYQGAILITRSQ